MKTDQSTSLHRNLLKALDPSILLLKGGPGSGAKPGPDQSEAAEDAWDVRGRGHKEEGKKRRKAATPKAGPKRTKFKGDQMAAMKAVKEIRTKYKAMGFEETAGKSPRLAPRGDGQYYLRQTLKHSDGRRVDLEMTYDPRKQRGEIEVRETEAVKIGSRRLHAQKAVNSNPDTLKRSAKDASVVKSVRLKGKKERGQGLTYEVKFADGTRGIYKPTKGTVLETGLSMPEGTEDLRETVDKRIPEKRRERTAYMISEALGFNVVPPVELVDYGRGDGHVQGFVEGTDAATEKGRKQFYTDLHRGHPDLHRIAALDVIMGNTDRHDGNFRLGKDGRWYAIDNGLAFPENSHHYEFICEIMAEFMHFGGREVQIPDEVREEIQSLDVEELREAMLQNGFSERDAAGGAARLEALKKLESWPTSTDFLNDDGNFEPSWFMDTIKA